MPVLWWMDLSLFLLMDWTTSVGVFGGFCELSTTLAACPLMDEVVFLSCWLFGVRCPALEPACSWAELGLGVKMDISRRAHTD